MATMQMLMKSIYSFTSALISWNTNESNEKNNIMRIPVGNWRNDEKHTAAIDNHHTITSVHVHAERSDNIERTKGKNQHKSMSIIENYGVKYANE